MTSDRGSVPATLLQLGLPDQFIEHGAPTKLLALQGLDASCIERSIRARFGAAAEAGRPSLKAVA